MNDEFYIDIAIEISKNAKYPYGAIVVKDGEIIGRSDDKTLMETSHIAIIAHKAPQFEFQVLTQGITWEEAIQSDWRKTKSWQPGWEYIIQSKL